MLEFHKPRKWAFTTCHFFFSLRKLIPTKIIESTVIGFTIINDALLRTLHAYMYVLKCARIINLFPHWHENVVSTLMKMSRSIVLIFFLIFGVLMPLSTIFQLYHGDQFVCQTNMHLIMWIENAFKFCVNDSLLQRTDFFSFLLWRWKTWGCQLTFIERCGSQADLSFTWCLQVFVVPLTVRWFIEDFPLSFIFNTAGFVHSACTSTSVISGATRLDSMYSCPGQYSPLQSLLMFGAEFVPRSVVLSPVCTTL